MIEPESITDTERLKFLHTVGNGNPDQEGYEWGVFKIKWDEHGRLKECWQTASDSSDLDRVIRLNRLAQAKLVSSRPAVLSHSFLGMWCENCRNNTHDTKDCWSTYGIDPELNKDIAKISIIPPFKKKGVL